MTDEEIHAEIEQLAADLERRGVSIDAIAQELISFGTAIACAKNGPEHAASLLELAARKLRDIADSERATRGDN